MLSNHLLRETQLLEYSWSRHKAAFLADYLVKGVEDPRIHIQSILSRHFLIDILFGQKYSALMEQEFHFALLVNWLMKLIKERYPFQKLQLIFDSLLDNQTDLPDIPVPKCIAEICQYEKLPYYLNDLLCLYLNEQKTEVPEYILNTFQRIWNHLLQFEQLRQNISLIEPACGSANDYRFIHYFNISQFINYTGFDLCSKNIRNAKRLFPDIRFKTGNILLIEFADNSFDYCIVGDLFEHLSIDAAELALQEVCRVTKKGLLLHFFNMHTGPEHIIRPTGHYYLNKLSAPAIEKSLIKYAADVKIVHIHSFLTNTYCYTQTHNTSSYSFYVDL